MRQLNIYFVALILSLLSTAFGILRELLVLAYLGLSYENDYLQIYLSVYFSTCLLSDPFKLAYLNLTSTRKFGHIMAILVAVGISISSALIFVMYITSPDFKISLLTFSAVDGLLGVIVALIICHKQKYGAYISSQLINILPNLILIPVVVWMSFFPKSNYVVYFLAAFFVIHIIQILMLYFVKVIGYSGDRGAVQANDVLICVRHVITIIGEQFFQVVGRMLLLNVGEGTVTIFSMFNKIFITGRYILIDSYIGTQLEKWHFSSSKDNFQMYLKCHYANFLIAILSIGLFIFSKEMLLSDIFIFSVIFIAYFYFSSLYRIGYFKINTYFHFSKLVNFIGIFDLIYSVLIYLVVYTYFSKYAMIYILSWCVLRLPLELVVLERYYTKARELYIQQQLVTPQRGCLAI